MAKSAYQSRSRETLQAILTATERLVKNTPYTDLSIADIVAEAGVSVGAFYGRFDSKADLLRELHHRYENYRNKYLAETLSIEQWKNADLKERVNAVSSAFVSLMTEKRGILKSFLIRYWSNPEELTPAFITNLTGAYDTAKLLLLDAMDGDAETNEVLCNNALAIIAGACRDIIILKPGNAPGKFDHDRGSLVDMLTLAGMGILKSGGRN